MGPEMKRMPAHRPALGSQEKLAVLRCDGVLPAGDAIDRYRYFDRDLARYQTVTRTSLQHAVQRYLGPGRRVTLSIVPRGRLELAIPDSTAAVVS